ncbi:PorP/SprF family type IX secretion system membrane protein [Arcticibacter eurypsychrophilus]|uniref:PorP/SprF family type IX secretion system membrane protein n=1 Tax=Arcticibacter eurypsychrophilus TaxID=1434752 RepID=UPI00084D696D|nr:type IX secretion system membrane protein PorP/SprF [Arcticibacter eurypsychrophilus]
MKRLKKLVGALCLLGCAISVDAQQNAMYTQYMFNTLAINPAYAGSRNVVSATALHRSQWSGLEGAPKTTSFTIDAPFNNKKVGLGLQLLSDKLGITSTTGAALSYAYRIRMAQGSLAFGIQGSAVQYQANYTGVDLGNSGAYDPAFSENINKFLFNFGTGVYYNSDRFYIGLSAQDLLNSRITAYEAADDTTGGSLKNMHLFFATGYVFKVDDNLKLKPSLLIKGVKGAPLEADLNAMLWIKDVVAVGAQYRTSADVAGILEIQASPQIRIGYSYDHSVTRLRNFNTGSHEIMIRYEFGFERGKILSPRYF